MLFEADRFRPLHLRRRPWELPMSLLGEPKLVRRRPRKLGRRRCFRPLPVGL